jgi:hypothetical protein
MKPDIKLATSSREPSVDAFTLSSLLSIIVVAALLAMLMPPALRRFNVKTEQIRCAANLRQLGQAALLYAQADRFERFPNYSGGSWPWDIAAAAANGLQEQGAARENFYCPAYQEMNNDFHWKWSVSEDGRFGFRLVGYAFAFQFAPRVRLTNTTDSLHPRPYRIGTTEYQPKASDRVLIADATLSNGSNENDRSKNNYTRIVGGSTISHRSPHLQGAMPSGGNLFFLDGHTEWRPFHRMHIRTDGNPSFWW